MRTPPTQDVTCHLSFLSGHRTRSMQGTRVKGQRRAVRDLARDGANSEAAVKKLAAACSASFLLSCRSNSFSAALYASVLWTMAEEAGSRHSLAGHDSEAAVTRHQRKGHRRSIMHANLAESMKIKQASSSVMTSMLRHSPLLVPMAGPYQGSTRATTLATGRKAQVHSESGCHSTWLE